MAESDLNTLSTFHTKNLRRILRIFWPETIPNQHLALHATKTAWAPSSREGDGDESDMSWEESQETFPALPFIGHQRRRGNEGDCRRGSEYFESLVSFYNNWHIEIYTFAMCKQLSFQWHIVWLGVWWQSGLWALLFTLKEENISKNHKRLKNTNWWEADKLGIYKPGPQSKVASTEKQI